MQLRDLMQEILEKKFPRLPVTRRPRALANEIDTGEMDIRRAAGIEPGTRRNQEKVFQLMLKILPICKDLGIDLAQDCDNPPTAEEIIGHAIELQPNLPISDDEPQGKRGAKKTSPGHVPPRRDPVHPRKKSR